MKVTVEAAALAAAIKRSAAERRSTTLPILAHVALDAEGGQLTVRGTDLECWTESRLEADVNNEGAVTCNASQLAGLVGRLEGLVTLRHDDDKAANVQVSAGRGRWRIDALPAVQFPVPTDEKIRTTPCSVDGTQIAEWIALVEYACNPGDARMPMRGVTLDADMVAATDGHRLAVLHVPTGIERPCLVPKAALAHLLPVLREGGTLAVGVRDGDRPVVLSAHAAAHSVRLALIDDRPMIQGIQTISDRTVSQKDGVELTVSREHLREALRRIAVVAPAVHKATQIVELRAGPDGLRVQAGNYGSELVPYTDEPDNARASTDMAFQLGYLLDALAGIATDTVEIVGAGADLQAAFCPTGDADRSHRHIVMQVRK